MDTECPCQIDCDLTCLLWLQTTLHNKIQTDCLRQEQNHSTNSLTADKTAHDYKLELNGNQCRAKCRTLKMTNRVFLRNQMMSLILPCFFLCGPCFGFMFLQFGSPAWWDVFPGNCLLCCHSKNTKNLLKPNQVVRQCQGWRRIKKLSEGNILIKFVLKLSCGCVFVFVVGRVALRLICLLIGLCHKVCNTALVIEHCASFCDHFA